MDADARREKRWLLVAGASAAVVVAAIIIEVLAGQSAGATPPRWASLVPLAWPTAARVVWWCAVAGAAAAFRLALARLGIRQHPIVVVASVGPFLVLAAGVAAGADWSTWH